MKAAIGLLVLGVGVTHFADAREEATQLSVEQMTSASNELKAKLTLLKQFSANFVQEVIDDEGQVIQTSQGSLKVSQPNLVNWHTTEPEETLIVSDGKDLWLYDPFVEQATVYTVQSSIANTPILLLTSVDDAIWQQYSVKKLQGGQYIVEPLDDNSRIQSLSLLFQDENSVTLTQFTMVDSSGQKSRITLSEVNHNDVIDAKHFQYSPPAGVDVDDQR